MARSGIMFRNDERAYLIMKLISSFIKKMGYCPTIRDCAMSYGVKSTSLANYYLEELEDLGYIARDPLINRSIRLTQSGHDLIDSVSTFAEFERKIKNAPKTK